MKIQLEAVGVAHRIRRYGPEGILIGDRLFSGGLILTSDRIIEAWDVTDAESIRAADIAAILELSPEVVLLGTGTLRREISPGHLAPLMERGIGVEVMDTGAACRTFNILAADDRRVAAALMAIAGGSS